MTDRERMIRLVREVVMDNVYIPASERAEFAGAIVDHLRVNGVGFFKATKIDDLDLNLRAYHALKRAGIDTIEQLKKWDRERLLNIRDVGEIGAGEILTKLSAWEKERSESDG